MDDKEKNDILGIDDPDKSIEGDKTSIPDENEENEEDEADEDKDKPIKSDIAQKIKYREKLKAESEKVRKLEADLADIKGMVKKPTDDAEARAQDYIRSQAKAVFDELQSVKKTEEDKITQQFEENIVEILEDNPDISEKELLEIIEDYEVEPTVALKILKKSSTIKKPKPKMPQAKRASASDDNKEKLDDSTKSMWQIAKEEAEKVKN